MLFFVCDGNHTLLYHFEIPDWQRNVTCTPHHLKQLLIKVLLEMLTGHVYGNSKESLTSHSDWDLGFHDVLVTPIMLAVIVYK